MKSQLPYLKQAYSDLYENIISYQISLSKQNELLLELSAPQIFALENLSTAVKDEHLFDKKKLQAQIDIKTDSKALHFISNLIDGWNQACKA
jgi:hypothetical protein